MNYQVSLALPKAVPKHLRGESIYGFNYHIEIFSKNKDEEEWIFLDTLERLMCEIDYRVAARIQTSDFITHMSKTYPLKQGVNALNLLHELVFPLPIPPEKVSGYKLSIKKPVGELFCNEHIILPPLNGLITKKIWPVHMPNIPTEIELNYDMVYAQTYISNEFYAKFCPWDFLPIDDPNTEIIGGIYSRTPSYYSVLFEGNIWDKNPDSEVNRKMSFYYQSHVPLSQSIKYLQAYSENEYLMCIDSLDLIKEGREIPFIKDLIHSKECHPIMAGYMTAQIMAKFKTFAQFIIKNEVIYPFLEETISGEAVEHIISYLRTAGLKNLTQSMSFLINSIMREEKKYQH